MFRLLKKTSRYFNCSVMGKLLAIATFLIVQMLVFPARPAEAAPSGQVQNKPPVVQPRQEASPAPATLAKPEQRFVSNPPVAKRRGFRSKSPVAIPEKDKKDYDLDLTYIESKFFNPTTGKEDTVNLRGYIDVNDEELNKKLKRKDKSHVTLPDGFSFVAPTIEVKPGETARVKLNNRLPKDPSCLSEPPNVNKPHCFNSTNLHSHGLWINPNGNGDNVLVSIPPGVSFQYEYNIPPDHPAGTFWYHPHLHGSTALQVSSGMAGALIVKGDRLPKWNQDPASKTKTSILHGDIDTLLTKDGAPLREEVLVFQQIQYACLDKNGKIKVKKQDNTVVEWVCDRSDVGGIEFYDDPGKNGLFGPGTWEQSGRFTSINGKIRPTFGQQDGKPPLKPGEITRWRLIHGGVRDTISLQFSPFTGTNISRINGLKAYESDEFVQNNCGDPINYHVIANDGLTRAAAWQTNVTTLQPGYRADALVVFPKAGDYCLVDTSAPISGSVNDEARNRRLLGVVKVREETSIEPKTNVQDIHTHLKNNLADMAYKIKWDSAPAPDGRPPIKAQVIADLCGLDPSGLDLSGHNGDPYTCPPDPSGHDLKLSLFTPHLDIADNEVTGKQELAFYIDIDANQQLVRPLRFEIGNHFNPPQYNGQPYDPNRVDRTLKVGDVDEWTLQSYLASHPFHIHVNPFQIVKILDPNGKDVSEPGAVDDATKPPECSQPDHDPNDPKCQPDPQYPGLKGVWKDTLWIKGSQYPNGIYTVVVRTRYRRYIGEFVLHCHILDHEDQGMMQNVKIVVPDGKYTDVPIAMTTGK